MLVNFTVENWQSYRDKVTLSMMASLERQHSERVPYIKAHHLRLLPVAAIYGGNASGKTKLFNALKFAKDFICRISQPEEIISVEPFLLEKNCKDKATSFIFEILLDDTYYELSFSVNSKKVVQESLAIISSKKDYAYKRSIEETDRKVEFYGEYHPDERLKFVAQGTRDNQLFITNTVSQQVDYFSKIYNYINKNFVFIYPASAYKLSGNFYSNKESMDWCNDKLKKLDANIEKIYLKDISIDDINLPNHLVEEIKRELNLNPSVTIGRDIVITKNNNKLYFKKLLAIHKNADGASIDFNLESESKGTLRLIDLLPAFYDLEQGGSDKIYIIDEIDRCLHTLATQALIEDYLENCKESSRTQLIFTTHDVQLMDQSLFRRDEMWLTERDKNGISRLFSIADYKDVRYDKDIRKSYLKGSFGGIPKII